VLNRTPASAFELDSRLVIEHKSIMPLTDDPAILALSDSLLQVFDTLFGSHPGFRAVHAKGLLLAGTFTPTREAAGVSRAQHLTRPSTPIYVRLSDNTGVPQIPDTDPNAAPRGLAIRFQLGEHVHTDIIAHSANAFPARNGQEFLEFVRAIAASAGYTGSPTPIEAFVGSHPAALAFVLASKPVPSSFAREAYFGLTAVRFINRAGEVKHGRYRFVPEAGVDHIPEEAVKAKGERFLFDELEKRVAAGPIRFDLLLQVAADSDVVDDVTLHWPDDRPVVNLGKIELTEIVPNNAHEQKTLIFDPIPRVDGLEPSADPLLELRAAIYLISGRRRRKAPE
jgi:catalase